MAILLVKIENENSLALNEFFDYGGFCYASTRSRDKTNGKVIDLTNFYDAAVNTEVLHDIPVVFVSLEDEENRILGWYRKAEIYGEMNRPSFFLEGNIKAYAGDVVWIPKEMQKDSVKWYLKHLLYEVVEEEDVRFTFLQKLMESYVGPNQFFRYHTANPHIIAAAMNDISSLKSACEQWAGLITADQCQDIRDLKTLEVYGKKLSQMNPKNSDGYYYFALACYHLGLVKEGIKQINKAMQLEPDASDLMALKGLLLVSKGRMEAGADLLHIAYEKSNYEAYLFMEGRAYLMAGQVDMAYDCFNKIEDESLLESMGIQSKDVENRTNFIRVTYEKLKNMIRRNVR